MRNHNLNPNLRIFASVGGEQEGKRVQRPGVLVLDDRGVGLAHPTYPCHSKQLVAETVADLMDRPSNRKPVPKCLPLGTDTVRPQLDNQCSAALLK